MSDQKRSERQPGPPDIGDVVGEKETRRLRAIRHKNRGVWFGLGTFGMVGWSVTIPTLLGLALGVWIDRNLPGRFSWSLMLLFIGLLIGCLSAWYWLNFESRMIQEEEANGEEEDE